MAVTPEELDTKTNNNLSTALGTTPTPLPIPKFQMPKTSQEALTKQAELVPLASQAEADVYQKQMDYDLGQKSAAAQASGQVYTGLKGKLDDQKRKEAEYEYPEFHPTQENALSIGSLFSLVSTLGVMLGGSGKMSAQNSMNAMTGILKGWQTGRKDLYDKEVKDFEKNFARIKQIRDDLRKDLEDYYKLAPYEKEAASAKLQEIAAKHGGDSIIKSMINRGDIQGIAKIYESASKLIEQKEKLASEAATRKEMALLRQTQSGGTDRYGFGNIIATNVNEAVGSIANIVMLPESSTTGFFQGRNTSGLINAPLGALTNNLTSEDVQRYNTEISNFGKFASRVVSGGRVVPASVQKDFDEQYKLREGDKPLTVLTKIAQMRQTLERASEVYIADPKTPEGIRDIYQRGLIEIRTAIPFTVNDINNIAKEKDKKKTFAEAFVEYGLREQPEKTSSSRFQEERNKANEAIKEGAPRDAVAKRFKTKTGEDF